MAKKISKGMKMNKPTHKQKAAKIVLCNPFSKYWPLVDENVGQSVGNLLKTLLVPDKVHNKVSWNLYRNMSKEQRIKEKKKMTQSLSEELDRQRKHIIIGINSVARSLQNMTIQSCLISGDVQNEVMISHIIDLACTRGIPLLVIPKMKEITTTALGFSTAAIGIMVKDELYYKPLNDTIQDLSTNFPVPYHYSWIKQRQNEKYSEVCKKLSSNVNENVPNRSISSTNNITNFQKSGKCSLFDDYMKNIFYIAPKFKKMKNDTNRNRNKLLKYL